MSVSPDSRACDSLLYSPEEAIAAIRAAHDQYIGADASKTTADSLAMYAAKVWQILDFTEKPKHTTLLKL